MELEGYSYEGYQPPLFYVLMAPFYAVLPAGVLTKLYALRWIMVALSLVTVWIAYVLARELFPRERLLPYLICLVLIVLPERTLSVSRLNNDVLLEVIAAAFTLVATRSILRGVNWRRSLVLGALLGLGLLTKMSMAVLAVLFLAVFWNNRRAAGVYRHLLLAGGATAVLVIPFLVHSLYLYGDLTGFSAFRAISNFQAPPLNLHTLVGAGNNLFSSFWVVWWKGGLVGSNAVLRIVYLLLGTVCAGSMAGLVQAWRAERRQPSSMEPAIRLVPIYGLMILACGIAVLISYLDGEVPVIQGRFFLPVILPAVTLLTWGAWRFARLRGVAVAIGMLAFLDILSLFGNLLPYFYYWSAFFDNGVPKSVPTLGMQQSWGVFVSRLLRDKPAGLRPLLGWLPPLYGMSLAVLGVTLVRLGSRRVDLTGVRTRLAVWLSQVMRDPLVWVTCVLIVLFLGLAAARPAGAFWSLDEGGKLLYVQNVVRTGDPAAPLIYPGRSVDPGARFIPLFFFLRNGDQIYSWWPPGFALLSLPFYALFGWIGLYIIPAVCGALCGLLAGAIFREVLGGGRWLAVGAALIVALATPVAFYSTLFWEHTPAVASFLGALLCLLYGWRTDKARWFVLAGLLTAIAVFLRTEIAGVIAGMGLVVLIWRWRRALLFGASCALFSVPWLLLNSRFTGHLLGPQWNNGGGTSLLKQPWLAGIQQVGWWYVPQVLFNSASVGAYEIPKPALVLAVIGTGLAVILPLIRPARWATILGYAGLIAVSGSVLFVDSGYRSVHGFVLIAPEVVFSAWLLTSLRHRRRSPFVVLSLAGTLVFGLLFLSRGWVAAGGLQWGPRYLLFLYPLFVVASLAGMATLWRPLSHRFRGTLLVFYLIAVGLGLGYQIRGLESASQTIRLYSQSAVALQKISQQPIVTDCTWLPMVIPGLYWEGKVFRVSDPTELTLWTGEAQKAGIQSARRITMDACSTVPLDQVAAQRQLNPDGLTIEDIVVGDIQ